MINYIQWSAEYRAEAMKIYNIVYDLTEKKKETRNPDEIYEINDKLIFYRSVLRDMHKTARLLNERARTIEKRNKE